MKVRTTHLAAASMVAAAAGIAAEAAPAFASYPLYCNGYYSAGHGCQKVLGAGATSYVNSARNENGGTVAIRGVYAGGYGAFHYGYNGAVVTSHLRSPKAQANSNPTAQCFMATSPAVNIKQLIHCRYNSVYGV